MTHLRLGLFRLIPLGVSKTPVLPFLLSLPYYPREGMFSLVDGFSRIVGITTFGVDTVLSHPNSALRTSPWAMVLVATLAGGGGGLIVPSFNGFHADWAFATPPWVKNGPGIDVWGATVIGYVYAFVPRLCTAQTALTPPGLTSRSSAGR